MSGPLFEHALRLHRQHPGGVLPRDGYPYPDDESERPPPLPRADQRLVGADVAAILDAHFARAGATPDELVFQDVDVPIHRNEHITAAALRADRQRVRRTGRWLVRHGTDRYAALVGLALLATGNEPADIPLIQTIGLLSDRFGALAADALSRRRGGEAALLWLARRVGGWGRVYVVEALCRRGGRTSRPWLLRHACDGDYLGGYFAGQVATAAHLHAAIVAAEVDDELVDHTGRLLAVMAQYGRGMGMTLAQYPPAPIVLAAHADHLGRQAPAVSRFVTAATLADQLAEPGECGCTAEQAGRITRQYLAVLNRPDWCAAVHESLEPEFFRWFADGVAARLRLRAFTDQRFD